LPEKNRKEKLIFNIERCSNKEWEYFKKYHYLNESLPVAHYYLMTLNQKKVGFISINKFPHPIAKDIMVISRLVIIPEFQGFQIGTKFMQEIAKIYNGNRIRITTSLKSFIQSIKKNKNWKCVRFGRVSSGSGSGSIHNKTNKQNFSSNRITATFEFISR
jgi:predicted acetyltransferase